MASEITEEKDDEVPCIINTEAQKKKIRQIIEYQKSLYMLDVSNLISTSRETVMTSEITEEKDEEVPCIIDTEAQKKKIRQIIEYQKSLYLSTSSSSSFSSAAASCSSFYSSHKSSSLLEMMKEGSTSLRRLIDMEHTSLGTHMKDYSGSPIIKPILLWGSDTDEIHDDPWSSVKRIGQATLADSGTGRLTSEGSHGDYSAYQKGETIVSKHKLSRTKSFRKLPRFSLRRCKGFRFRLKLRRLRILICGRMF